MLAVMLSHIHGLHRLEVLLLAVEGQVKSGAALQVSPVGIRSCGSEGLNGQAYLDSQKVIFIAINVEKTNAQI